ncbi:MAG: S1 family peptidase, partial [Verrucomicrobiota bacterium]|nr:S1 family peptidase [Verrucomicrobiota bacterium]
KLAEFVPFQFTATTFPNLVDAALAKVRRQDVTSAIRLIGVPKGVSTVLRRGMQVQKTGRTTDHTFGIIKDINLRSSMTYKKPGGGTGRAGFFDQVLCTRYTAGGDSGSAVLNMSGKVVGLHYAGSPTTSLFNKIARVRAALGIEIVTTAI